MSTRISDSRALALVALLPLLGGCVTGMGGTGGAPSEIAVTSDQVVIAGPRGFCVDESVTRTDGDTAFVLLGNCAAISGSRRAIQPDMSVVLTAAVSEASDAGSISESMDELDTYFRSDAGLTLLSRSQDAETVMILETEALADMFLLHARDTSAGAVRGVGEAYWRAYFDVGPRIATLSVLALDGEGVTREQSLSALMEFTQTVQAANMSPGGDAVASAPDLASEEDGGLFNVGLFR